MVKTLQLWIDSEDISLPSNVQVPVQSTENTLSIANSKNAHMFDDQSKSYRRDSTATICVKNEERNAIILHNEM